MSDTFIISKRFHGPPNSGNGGYVCGELAELFDGDCQVTLMAPPPLEIPMEVQGSDQSTQLLVDGKTIAEARPFELFMEIPPAPSYTDAEMASQHYAGFHEHPLPTCFVCGPKREAGDGLRIFPGPVDSFQLACTWTPADDLADSSGEVLEPFIWAALDCPGYFAVQDQAGLALLGRFAVKIHEPVMAGQTVIISSWPIDQDGRKHYAGTAIHSESGELLAMGYATWISIKIPDIK